MLFIFVSTISRLHLTGGVYHLGGVCPPVQSEEKAPADAFTISTITAANPLYPCALRGGSDKEKDPHCTGLHWIIPHTEGSHSCTALYHPEAAGHLKPVWPEVELHSEELKHEQIVVLRPQISPLLSFCFSFNSLSKSKSINFNAQYWSSLAECLVSLGVEVLVLYLLHSFGYCIGYKPSPQLQIYGNTDMHWTNGRFRGSESWITTLAAARIRVLPVCTVDLAHDRNRCRFVIN